MVKNSSGKLVPKTEKIFLDQMVEALQTNGLNPYILTFEDFSDLPDILQ